VRRSEQLVSKLTDVKLPDSVQYFSGGGNTTHRVHYQSLPVSAFVRWPSNKPCMAVNTYLLDQAHRWTGDSVITEANKLVELVRFCAHGRADRRACDFGDLSDNDVARLIDKLCTDAYVDDVSQRVRNNNTVRAIMQSCFRFLHWYQDTLYMKPFPLIGDRNSGAAITVMQKVNPHSNRSYFDHRYLPPTNTQDPKLPISNTMIEDIEAVVEELYDAESYPEPARRRFGRDYVLFDAYRVYMTARRDFMLMMMERTGLRPSELAAMSLADNLCSTKGQRPYLVLPTLKRRRLNPPPRHFHINNDLALRVRIYMRERNVWLETCQERNPELTDHDAMLLSTEPGKHGHSIANTALEKDFEKLCLRAGYKGAQSCLSMFRHRFITLEVRLHLKELGKGKTELNKQDYRIVLEKVKERTGHKSIDSLWHYIDLAYEMDGVWEPVRQAEEQMLAADQLRYELRHLRREWRHKNTSDMTPEQVIDLVVDRLGGIINKSVRGGLAR